MQRVRASALRAIYAAHGPKGLAKFIVDGLEANKKDKTKGFRPEQVSIKDLAYACGIYDPIDGSDNAASAIKGVIARSEQVSSMQPEHIVEMAHQRWDSTKGNAAFSLEAALTTSIFPVVTGQLLSQMIIDAYESAPAIGEQLVTVVDAKLRNQKIAGFTSLGGPLEVAEANQYSATGFGEKYVVSSETKKGRILEISEELILFDQTGEILRRAQMIGDMVKQDWDRSIVRAVCDADSGSSVYVWRPNGTGETLYNTDGSNYNYIGASNTTSTSFNAQKVLTDWTTLDHVRKYRATEVKDDRIDGTQRAIGMINTGLTLLVPESLRGVADTIVYAPTAWTEGATTSTHYGAQYANPARGMVSSVLSSPYVDEINSADYYIGQFKKQFIYTQIWPIQTFLQGSNSESAFNADIAFRIKARYYGGVTAVDQIYVTKVDG